MPFQYRPSLATSVFPRFPPFSYDYPRSNPMFSWFKKKHLPDLADFEKLCPDCGTERGKEHDLFCTKERCPFCGGQLLSCECIHDVLALGAEERQAVEEYVDDDVEPLRGIMNRWKLALRDKGRVPFMPTVLAATPESLLLAAARGELPFVRTILAGGVPIDATNEVGYTALMAAARNYRLEVLAFLLRSGADVHSRDKYGHTPLHCAVGSPSFESPSAPKVQAECVRLLLDHGANPNAKNSSGGTPLMSAAWFGCASSINCLLNAGADRTLRDDRGRSAADLARERGHREIASVL